MFPSFFLSLKEARLPVSLREYLTLMAAMQAGIANYRLEDFYHLARTCLIKDERHFDRFDQVFSATFAGIEQPSEGFAAEIPAEWLEALSEKHLTEAEKAEIAALGGWDKLMNTLRERLAEQQSRHQGGSKWIGTGGTSPFGAYGYNPEGVRIGQEQSRHRRAVKVWDRREFRDFDDHSEIGTRNIKVALRRLRRWARLGAADQFDLTGTISSTARNGGALDIRLVPERRNTVKVLLLLDVGGSMDDHIKTCDALFSAARSEFKHLEHFYFHNCPYETLWRDNRRRDQRIDSWSLLHRFPSDWKLIMVGDAAMSPYEITMPGGSVEHWNAEAGSVWLERLSQSFPHLVWLNPLPEPRWRYMQSVGLIRQLVGNRMFPLTLDGLNQAMGELNR